MRAETDPGLLLKLAAAKGREEFLFQGFFDLADAVVCAEAQCDAVFRGGRDCCPKCGSRGAFLSLAVYVNGVREDIRRAIGWGR